MLCFHTVTLEHQTLASFQSMKILIAPDSFKGSASATDTAAALAAGLSATLPGADLVEHPLADGGEGTLDVLLAHGATVHHTLVHDSFQTPITAAYATLGSSVVIESAQAFGFHAGATPADALRASSAGVGELILAALEHKPTDILLTVGGTSGTDGGVGMLHALGATFRDVKGAPLAPGGGSLSHLDTWDATGLDPRLMACRIRVLTDVNNPLLGPQGAATVFAPQKGANPAAVAVLEGGLAHLAACVSPEGATLPGAGAGGGLGFAAIAVLGASRESGAKAVMELSGFWDHLAGADVVITGEGSFDDQSLHGKTTGVVIDAAVSRGIPVVVVCGVSRLTTPLPGIQVIELSADQPSLQFSLDHAVELAQARGAQLGARLHTNIPGRAH
jgi:glycerate 2-kinase